MFAALFGFALVVIAVLSYLLWEASGDRDCFKNRVRAWVENDSKTKAERIKFDESIQRVLKSQADSIAKLKAESDHNYNEGKAAQLELDKLRDRLSKSQSVLFGEVPGNVRIGTTPPKGWDVLKVTN